MASVEPSPHLVVNSSQSGGAARKVSSIQALRAIAALMVVTAHVGIGFEDRFLGGWSLLGWFPGWAGVDLFFVISGVVMTLTMWGCFQERGAARRFLYRRVIRIYPMYWLVTAAMLMILVASPREIHARQTDLLGIIGSFLLLPQDAGMLLLVGWTLTYEMLFYVFFAVALVFARRWLPYLVVSAASAVLALHLLFPRPGNPWLAVASDLLNLEFAFGVGVGALIATDRLRAPRAMSLLAAALSVIVIAWAALTTTGQSPSSWLRVALGATASVAVYAAVGMEVVRCWRVPRLVRSIGDASYSLYLIHVPFFAAHVATVIVTMVGVVVASLLSYRFLERPMLGYFRSRARRREPQRRPGRTEGGVAAAVEAVPARDAGR